MDEKQLEQDTVSPSESPEAKSGSQRKTEISTHNSGAIPKSGARSKTGGVRLGSFRLGGKKKAVTDPPGSKEDSKASRKMKKGKTRDSETGDDATPECRHSKTSNITRKLSIGKRNSSTVSRSDVSLEDDRYSTASSSTSVATGGRPSLEGEDGEAPTVDQSATGMERELWLDLEEEKQTSTKDQLLQITTPVLAKQQMGETDSAQPDVMPGPPQSTQAPDGSAQQVGEKREHLYKILVIGELGTGKTSIIKRYVHQFFSQHYRATIGVDFALKVLNWDANTIIRLQLWDIAGQERFGNMTRVYYKEAVGAFIVFDVTRTATFEAVVKWKQDLDTKVQLPDGTAIPCVLLANKCDQQKEGLVNNSNKMDEYCRERGFTAWFETSAKENINIEEAANCLVTKILQNDKMIHHNESTRDLEKFALDGKNQRDQKNSKTCSC